MGTTFNIESINLIAVITLTIISFPLGALWHSKVLFGKAWATDSKAIVDKTNKSGMITLFGSSAVLHFIAISGLAALINADYTWLQGLLTGLVTALAFSTTTIGVTHLFPGRSWRLILIDVGFYIILFSLAGAILAIWR